MTTTRLPSAREMYAAVTRRDTGYEGVFVLGVRTTGVFCRPGCPARTPRPENVEYFRDAGEALASGYRACQRCRPLVPAGEAPAWLAGLLDQVDAEPTRRWRDADLRERGLQPGRVRRWFRAQHGMTFHAFLRARRLGAALGRLKHGADVLGAGLDHGFDSASGFHEAFNRVFGTPPGRARGKQLVTVSRLTTPLGPMLAGACDDGLCLLEFHDRRALDTQVKRMLSRLDAVAAPGNHEHITRVEEQLAEWFAGTRRDFDLPLVIPGTPFQEAVWARLASIPYGETCSYAGLAEDLGRPDSQRAVGRANGDNRLAILIPCHRVVRSDGNLCGYGGGLWRKHVLLDHEREHCE